ncbi:hypothetical protein D3C75_637680 [compost metagenome]
MLRNDRLQTEGVIAGMEAKHVLGGGAENPACRSRNPGEHSLACPGIIRTEVHIGQGIRLAAGKIRRVGFAVRHNFEHGPVRLIAPAQAAVGHNLEGAAVAIGRAILPNAAHKAGQPPDFRPVIGVCGGQR